MKTIPQLLAEFGKQGGCDAFRGDAKQIELVTLYLFMRMLTPSLPFETFLQMYTPFANPLTEGNTIPELIISSRLPRAKTTAAKLGVRQWSAKEVIGYLALYVDMVREAESTQTAVPLTLLQWVDNPNLQKMFMDGAFDTTDTPAAATTAEAAPETTGGSVEASVAGEAQNQAQAAPEASAAAAEGSAVVPAATAAAAPVAPTTKKTRKKTESSGPAVFAPGARVIYTHPSGVQFRAVVLTFTEEGGRGYVDILEDGGQRLEDIAATSVTSCDSPLPLAPSNANYAVLPRLEAWIIDVEPEELANARRWLSAKTAVAEKGAGETLWFWEDKITAEGTTYLVTIRIVNGDDKGGPYVDAFLADADSPPSNPLIVQELPPREYALLGQYDFIMPAGYLRVVMQKSDQTVKE